MKLFILAAFAAIASCSDQPFHEEGVIEHVDYHDVCPAQQPGQSKDDYNLSIALDENLDHCRTQ